jgi:hypothetical protein
MKKSTGFAFNNLTEEASQREMGFYWVDYYGRWEVVQWNGDNWSMCGIGAKVNESDFLEISKERIKSPQETAIESN